MNRLACVFQTRATMTTCTGWERWTPSETLVICLFTPFWNSWEQFPVSILVACAVSLELPFHELGGTSTAVTGKRLRTWLLQLRNSNCVFRESPLVYAVLDGYNKARHGAEVGTCRHLFSIKTESGSHCLRVCVFLPVGFWWSRIFGVPTSSKWTGRSVSELSFFLRSFPFILIPSRNVKLSACSLPLCLQRQVLQRQLVQPAPPIRGQRPEQQLGAHQLLLLPHSGQLPCLSGAAAEQAAQTPPGAEELQRQLQHSGQLFLRIRYPHRNTQVEDEECLLPLETGTNHSLDRQ